MWDSNLINYQGKLCNHVKLYYNYLCCLINISIPQLKFLGVFLSALYFSISIYVFISVFPFSQLCIQTNYKAIDHGRRVSYNFLPVFASPLCKKYFPLPQCLPHKLFQEGMNHICLLIPKRSHRCCTRNTNPAKKIWSPLVFFQWNVLVVASLISVTKDES